MIIVTGGYGFIGSNLVHELNRTGCTNLIIVDDLSQGEKYKNLLGAEFSKYYDCDTFFSDFRDWSQVNAVYHQGAISSTTETNGKLMLDRNYSFSCKLFEQAINWRIPVSYASSASVYGNSPDGKLQPLNLYAYSKMLVDKWVTKNIDKFSCIHGWRYFNVYGNNEQHKHGQSSPITTFRQQIEETGCVKIFQGSSKIYRDFVCVDDIVQVIVASMDNQLKSGIRDLGTGVPESFSNIAKNVAEKYSGRIITIPFPPELLNSYQYFTQAKIEVNYNFRTVKDWLKAN